MQRIGTNWKTDWPKLGPSILIATALVVAIRTSKWVAKAPRDARLADVDMELDNEVAFAARMVHRIMTELTRRKPDIFPGQHVAAYDGIHEEDLRE